MHPTLTRDLWYVNDCLLNYGLYLDGMSQRDLIAQAFAGDDVIADFEAEKQEEAEKEGPKIEAPSLLPGWGTWASNQKEPEWMAKAKLKVQK